MKTYYPCPVCGRMAPTIPLINAYKVLCNACGQMTVIYNKGTAEDPKQEIQYNKILYEREDTE